MIYVDAELLQPSSEWAEEAAVVMQLLINSNPEDRDALIERYSNLWRAVRDDLRRMSTGKCWYCETADIRADCPVDHFRPKKRVAEVTDHPGYWWLAFDTTNFRYCCTFCNSRRIDQDTGVGGGKADHFPLLDESTRAYGPDDDAFAECPILLDPVDPEDPTLLWFDERGEALSRRSESENPTDFERATKSIELYHLNHSYIVSARAAVAAAIQRRVKRIDTYLLRENTEPTARQAIKAEMREIRRLMDGATPFCATARCVLRGYRTRPWVEQMLGL